MDIIYDNFITLSDNDQYILFDKIKNLIRIKKENQFIKQLKTDFNVKIHNNYFILTYNHNLYKIILFADDTIKLGINTNNTDDIESHFKSIDNIVIGKDTYIYYRCKECYKVGDNNSDTDIYFEEYTGCINCKNKFVSITCNIPNTEISNMFTNYNTKYIKEFNALLETIYNYFNNFNNFKNILENKCLRHHIE